MWIWVYLYLFFFSFLLACILTSIARRVAIYWNIVDHPAERKVHQRATPLLGGIAIYLAFTLTVIINILLLKTVSGNPTISRILPSDLAGVSGGVRVVLFRLTGILGGGALIVLLGLRDDVRGMTAYWKLVVQILIACILVLLGIRVTIFIPSRVFGGLVTIFWVVAISNAFNLLDNMDGLAAGVTFVSCMIFFTVAYNQGQIFVSSILLVLAGSVLGFLRHNFHPARIFMGDAGSLFIGYILAVLTVLSTFYQSDNPTLLPIVMPLLILGVPIFDTLSVIYIRLKRKESIFKADRNHFSHRLVALGMSVKQAVFFVYLVTFVVGISATLLAEVNINGGILILIQAVAIFAVIGILEKAGRGRRRKYEKQAETRRTR